MNRVMAMMAGAVTLMALGTAPVAADPDHRHHRPHPHDFDRHGPPDGPGRGPRHGPPPGPPPGPGPGPAEWHRPAPPDPDRWPDRWQDRDYVRVPEPQRVYPRRYYVEDCPRGMILRGDHCEYPRRYGHQVGDILPRDAYAYVDDPYRYDLEQRRGWSYYRDDNSIYRVDSGTRKVLAVLSLLQALQQ